MAGPHRSAEAVVRKVLSSDEHADLVRVSVPADHGSRRFGPDRRRPPQAGPEAAGRPVSGAAAPAALQSASGGQTVERECGHVHQVEGVGADRRPGGLASHHR